MALSGGLHRRRFVLRVGMSCAALEAGVVVAALPRKIQLGVFELVLVERKLRLDDLELRRRRIVGGRRLRQLGDALLVRVDACSGLRDASVELRQRTSGGWLVGRRLPDGRGEGLIQFVVGEARRLPVELLLGGRLGDRCQLARGIQQAAVDGRRAGGRCAPVVSLSPDGGQRAAGSSPQSRSRDLRNLSSSLFRSSTSETVNEFS